MKIKLNENNKLFQRLSEKSPEWWNNLKSDKDIYIDVRKGNYLNVYHNGGSIMKLQGTNSYKAEIHFEYIPLKTTKDYVLFDFQNQDVAFSKCEPIKLNNFKKNSLQKIKKRIRKFYPNSSEKGLQGTYITKNNHSSKKKQGFFIDTEFQYDGCRIDMVWVDIKTKKICFVELKTIGDERLFLETKPNNKKNKTVPIDLQLSKYYEFVQGNKDQLIEYYNRVYCIKKRLEIIPDFVKEKSLLNYSIIEKPILLIGDCTQKWIDNNALELNERINKISFGVLYQGRTTNNFRIPYKTSKNCYNFS